MRQTVVELKLGYGCSQNCRFCCFRKIHGMNLTSNEIYENLDYIKRHIKKIDTFIISGGEPTLYDEFWNVLKYIKINLNPGKIVIHTNGILFSNKLNAMKIKKYNPILMVSFHTLNNVFFKKNISNVFNVGKMKDAIKNLKKNKIKTTTNTLIFDENIDELDKIVNFLVKNGVGQLELRIPYSLEDLVRDEFMIKNFDKTVTTLSNVCRQLSDKRQIIFHPSTVCIISQFCDDDKNISYLKKFCISSEQPNRAFYFFDKLHQSKKRIRGINQISSVMPEYKKYFYAMKICKKCDKRAICHGVPSEYSSRLPKNTKPIF